MNHLLRFFLLFPVCLLCLNLQAQKNETMVFYNLENYFDTINDPLTLDDEFTARGTMKWNSFRYHKKQKDIFKVLAAMGEWQPPALICLAEVENSSVLEDLIKKTPLNAWNYSVVHHESMDPRGMDVALLYRNQIFQCDTSYHIPMLYSYDSVKRSRDILYVKGRLHDSPLHIFVNHWSSRRGGVIATEAFRMQSSETLLSHVYKIYREEPSAAIIITGDFNDEASDPSLKLLCGKDTAANLYALPFMYSDDVRGTLKYRGKWFTFDQFYVSLNMLNDTSGVQVDQKKANIFVADFLLKPEKHHGKRPFRTYTGSYYAGGYSDHLPVYIKLSIR